MSGPGAVASRLVPAFGKRRDTWPGALAALVATAGLAAWRAGMSRSEFEDLGQGRLGVAALVLLVASLAFVARKRLYGSRLGRLRPYYLAHVWLGAAWGPAVWLHAGAVSGPGLRALAALVAATWASGVVLAVLQAFFLARLRAAGGIAGLSGDLEAERARLEREIAELAVAPGVERLAAELRPGVAAGRAFAAVVRDPQLPVTVLRAARERLAAEPGLAAEVRSSLERLADDGVALLRIEAELGYHRMRARLLGLHAVVSAAALALVVVHLLAVWRY